ncbi:nuclear transport factor 2 family protein [Microtetraspora malaysiensis]|uniref:nuclear transport factor 2 family protein n=1 Tax=Microtetraspora malaysiensis TaxID=161358 RepID=UPI003D903CC8
MSHEDVIKRYWEAYNGHDVDAVLALMSDDVIIQFPTTPQPIRGKESIRPVWSMLFSKVIPDIHEEVVRTVIEGDTAACEFVETGTLTVPPGLGGAPSSGSTHGRPYRTDIAAFFSFNREGLIERVRSYWDTGAFAEQVGIDIAVIRSMQSRARTLT